MMQEKRFNDSKKIIRRGIKIDPAETVIIKLSLLFSLF
jgi:hypothetical protein